ncbi:MAG: hypothetical protein ACREJ2_04855 [Planctomycetota bacterium]
MIYSIAMNQKAGTAARNILVGALFAGVTLFAVPLRAADEAPSDPYLTQVKTKLDHRALLPADIQALTTYCS